MYLEDLSDKIWKTKNARFIASKRMKRSRNSSTVSVALLSASIIAVNILAFLNISEIEKTFITIVTLALSTFALVMSLLISHLRYEYRETNYHQCGLELDYLNQRLKIRIKELYAANDNDGEIESPNEDNLQYLDEYNKILRKYNLNHEDFDYSYSLIKAGSDKVHKLQHLIYWVRWNIFDVSVLYWLLAIIPVVGVVIAFFAFFLINI